MDEVGSEEHHALEQLATRPLTEEQQLPKFPKRVPEAELYVSSELIDTPSRRGVTDVLVELEFNTCVAPNARGFKLFSQPCCASAVLVNSHGCWAEHTDGQLQRASFLCCHRLVSFPPSRQAVEALQIQYELGTRWERTKGVEYILLQRTPNARLRKAACKSTDEHRCAGNWHIPADFSGCRLVRAWGSALLRSSSILCGPVTVVKQCSHLFIGDDGGRFAW
mmetsp:Transcript_46710/g.77305  ORF Transcript_46710/g.77305 Transcript_46710/m.77305 type:complete len:222 (-) Transcript_46710:176-841(-)